MDLLQRLAIARGDEPADLVLKGGRVVNVFTGEIVEAEVALAGGWIVGVGGGYVGRQEIDLKGRYICPGLIDAHVHIESSMVIPFQFARAVVPRGTTTVVCDPHEIANVVGAEGVRYILAASEGLPLTVYVNLPSCVPATPMGTAGAELGADDLLALADHPRVLGLAEMMNVPGLVLGVPDVVKKVEAFQGRVIDGHAPGFGGKWLQAYVGAGVGSDHECTTVPEMLEKLRLGMYVFIREATGAKNLRDLLPGLTPYNSRRCAFCTDDRHPADLLDEGHIDHLIRLAVAEGLDPLTAIRMATLNAAEYFRLYDRGAVAPGKRADLVVFSDLKNFRAEMVFAAGRLVAQAGEPVGEWAEPQADDTAVRGTVHVDWDHLRFDIPAPDPAAGSVRVRVIGIVPDQITTEHLVEDLPVQGGQVVADVERDLLKIAVIERHRGTGNVGLGFVHGLGLKRGALAGSVGHDAHNLIVAGCDDASMMTAARAVADLGGGLVAAAGDEVLASVPLPVAGLMSDQPVETVRHQMDRLIEAARSLGSPLHDPFMTLGFLALEVIPALRLTDQGLVDVEKFDFVPLFAG
ncbi:MAG TPA: adenine deaminase [Chloroflexi bacterium]|nr:adenine deaminase [Chloroflexota bacterium]